MKKTIALLLAFVLVLGVAIGGTIAWLTAETPEVKNTFTVGNINIELWENKYDTEKEELDTTADLVKANDNYHFVPGDTLPKNPWVTVKANSEACYLFVKVEENNNNIPGSDPVDKIIDWEVSFAAADGTTVSVTWQQYGEDVVDANNNVTEFWYCEVPKTSATLSWYILKDNKVTVDTDVTKDMVAAINGAKPTLTFDAAAVQSDNLTLEGAWDELPAEFTGSYTGPATSTPEGNG